MQLVYVLLGNGGGEQISGACSCGRQNLSEECSCVILSAHAGSCICSGAHAGGSQSFRGAPSTTAFSSELLHETVYVRDQGSVPSVSARLPWILQNPERFQDVGSISGLPFRRQTHDRERDLSC